MENIKFDLDRDIVFFDIESTGLNVIKDRILQIALVKYPKGGGEPSEISMLINPRIPISDESFAIHKISNEMIKDKPSFDQVGQEIYDFIGQADIAGYNSDRFDIPMLMEEFHRIGLTFDISSRRLIDVQKIFYKMEPRTLKAAYKHYCDQVLEDAHDAMADVKATIEVFKGQLSMYKELDHIDGDGFVTPKPIQNNMETIYSFLKDDSMLDVTNRLKFNAKGQIIFNFGKYTGHVVADVFRNEPNYYHWIIDKDFSVQVKVIVTKIFDELKK